MFGKKLRLFRLWGIEVGVDASWLIIALLVVWSLSLGYFPVRTEGLSPAVYLGMAVVGAIGLFASVIVHEFCHALTARKLGLEMKGITLFLFGGVAEMGAEPEDPRSEFLMAVAGPLASFGLAAGFWGVSRGAAAAGLTESVVAVLGYLAVINLLLGAFNMLPAFPLDGGRVLRAALWRWKHNVIWATRWAANLGAGFGLLLMGMGILGLFTQLFVSGVWWILLGFFLYGAARAGLQEVLMKTALQGETIDRFVMPPPAVARPGETVAELVDDVLYRHHDRVVPVVEDDRLVGCVGTREVSRLPRKLWSQKTVSEVASQCSAENTVEMGTGAEQALALMRRLQLGRLMVLREGRFVGTVALRDVLEFLSLKLELESGTRA